MMTYQIPYIAVAALILVGLYAVVYKRNLIKIIIGITLIQSGVNLFLITLGFREKSIAPIFTNADPSKAMSLPVPQALTLTSIVIGVAVLALMVSFVIHIYRLYGTMDVRKIRGDEE